MARERMGDACAFIPGVGGERNRYVRIGVALRDGDRISVNIDALPLPNSGWEGWINIFPDKEKEPAASVYTPAPVRNAVKPGSSGFDDMEDDIPF